MALATETLALVIKGCWWKATWHLQIPVLLKGQHSVSRALWWRMWGSSRKLGLEEYLHILVRTDLKGKGKEASQMTGPFQILEVLALW